MRSSDSSSIRVTERRIPQPSRPRSGKPGLVFDGQIRHRNRKLLLTDKTEIEVGNAPMGPEGLRSFYSIVSSAFARDDAETMV